MIGGPQQLARSVAEATGLVSLVVLLSALPACSALHSDRAFGARAPAATSSTERSAYIEFLWSESDWVEAPAPRPIRVVVRDAAGAVLAEACAEPEDTRPGTGFWRLRLPDGVFEHQADPTLIVPLPVGGASIEVEAQGCAPESLPVLPEDGTQVHLVVLRPL